MKTFVLGVISLCFLPLLVHAEPSKEQYASRVRAETLLKAEMKGDGSTMSAEQAEAFSAQVIDSLKTINTNQLKKGMTCPEIKEFVNETLGKKFEEKGMSGVVFQIGKYIEADCSVQSAWKS